MKKKLNLLFILLSFILLSLYNCDNETEEPKCPMFDIVPEAPYSDPVWHPSGDIIGFNHRPIKEIHYTYGYDCPHQARYIYDEDSTGFWLINADGTNKRRILPYQLTNPAWSPDGNWIAFSRNAQICIMPFDGEKFDTTSIVQLTSEGRNFFPSWSPDGERITYNRSVCDGPETCGIWLVDINNRVNEFIASYGNYPSWHNSNDSIVYSTNVLSSNGEDIGDSLWLYSFSNNKNCLLKIFSLPNYDNRYFMYSPDNKKIGFVSSYKSGEGIQLCITNNNGEGLEKITHNGSLKFSWSPYGKIVYVNYDLSRIDETKGTLWIMEADGSNKRQLTHNHFTITK